MHVREDFSIFFLILWPADDGPSAVLTQVGRISGFWKVCLFCLSIPSTSLSDTLRRERLPVTQGMAPIRSQFFEKSTTSRSPNHTLTFTTPNMHNPCNTKRGARQKRPGKAAWGPALASHPRLAEVAAMWGRFLLRVSERKSAPGTRGGVPRRNGALLVFVRGISRNPLVLFVTGIIGYRLGGIWPDCCRGWVT